MADTQTENISRAIDHLINYTLECGLITPADRTWAINALLEVLERDTYVPALEKEASKTSVPTKTPDLATILETLTDDAVARGVVESDSIVYRDLFDTALMGRLTPLPREIRATYHQLFEENPQSATNWYYRLSQDTNYIRRDRMAKDVAWTADTEYGTLDLTINLAKPEKDPKAIAAARDLPTSEYPLCLLCVENEGYAGNVGHPARQNHRVVPVTINDSPWSLQYSPYVYYNEHCIVLNNDHTPMAIDRAAFQKLLDFVGQYPHYFVGSNADLPIVGGSILAHDHFQGGRYQFPMEKAPIVESVDFEGFEDVRAGIVKWPLSVIRLTGADPHRLVDLSDKILRIWRGYTDEDSFVFAKTQGEPHNTITPIARRRGDDFELDLVLRNNITTEEHPLGVYHPHAELHHIKKENIGLIEVMGLAVLPARLKEELAAVAQGLRDGSDLRANPLTAPHADWAEGFADEVRGHVSSVDETREKDAHSKSEAGNEVSGQDKGLADEEGEEIGEIEAVIEREVGKTFATVLEHAGVYKWDEDGRAGFRRFIDEVNAQEGMPN